MYQYNRKQGQYAHKSINWTRVANRGFTLFMFVWVGVTVLYALPK